MEASPVLPNNSLEASLVLPSSQGLEASPVLHSSQGLEASLVLLEVASLVPPNKEEASRAPLEVASHPSLVTSTRLRRAHSGC